MPSFPSLVPPFPGPRGGFSSLVPPTPGPRGGFPGPRGGFWSLVPPTPGPRGGFPGPRGGFWSLVPPTPGPRGGFARLDCVCCLSGPVFLACARTVGRDARDFGDFFLRVSSSQASSRARPRRFRVNAHPGGRVPESDRERLAAGTLGVPLWATAPALPTPG